MTQSQIKAQNEMLVPGSYSRLIARVLGLQERELGKLLRGTGLATEVLRPGDETRMTSDQQIRVLENARQMMAMPEIGLYLGQSLTPTTHGPMGYLVLSSPDVKTALESFADFLPFRFPFSSVTISYETSYETSYASTYESTFESARESVHEGRWLVCTLGLSVDVDIPMQAILQECFALMIQSVIETVLGRPLKEGYIELVNGKPGYSECFSDYLHSPVSFGHAASRFAIPESLAWLPNVNGNSESYAVAQGICQKLLAKATTSELSTADQVKQLLLSSPFGSLNAIDVASAMFITKRTLQRRLADEGVTYRQLTDQLLSQLAVKHLCESSLTVESIALTLGYHDAAAFRKAFHRWYGVSPSLYRDQHA